MSVLGGSNPIAPSQVMGRLNGIVVPDFEGAAATQSPAPPTAAPSKPQSPAPLQDIPNVSQASTDAQSVVSSVDLPDFGITDQATEPVQAASPAPLPDDDLEADLPETPAAENFKKLRGVVKSERQAKRELEAKLQETAQRLESYEKGEVVPEIIRAKDERIAQLEPYEKVLNLKMSPEYQESFVQPAIALRQELEKLGADYGLPPQIMHHAVGIDNRKELNHFLSQHFDDVGGLEVKRIVTELQDLGEKALEAEKEPQATMQALKAQYADRQEEERLERARVFEVTAKDAWNAALEKTNKEGAYKELVLHPTDKEFNKNVVEPIQYKASVQYGALVKKLSENGLKTLPPDLATGLARMVLLSIGGALSMDAKYKAETTASALSQNMKRTNGYIRPHIGGQNGSGHQAKAPAQQPLLNPRSAAEAAARVFNK